MSCYFQEGCKLGENAYQSEGIPLLHITRPINAKVIKARAHKFALMKGTQILINEERHITTFKKALRHQIFLSDRKQNKTKCFYLLGSKIRLSMLYLEINCSYGLMDQRKVKQFSNIISLSLVFSRRGSTPNLSLRSWPYFLLIDRSWYEFKWKRI